MRTRQMMLLVGAVAVACGAVLLVWRGPWWFDGDYLSEQDLRSGSAALVTGFRTSVVQLLAILGAGIALLFTAFNYRLTHRGQVTDRFIKALERLGSEELYVRIGGVLALEQIIQDAPDQTAHAVQVLNVFLRRRAPGHQGATSAAGRRDRIAIARQTARRGSGSVVSSTPHPDRPEADVACVLRVLSRPEVRKHISPRQKLDLSVLHFEGATFDEADLAGAMFHGANLTNVGLVGANLTGAWFSGADLTRAALLDADLTDALFDGAEVAYVCAP